jgi:hypothetical protein
VPERFPTLRDGTRIYSSEEFCPLNFRMNDRNLDGKFNLNNENSNNSRLKNLLSSRNCQHFGCPNCAWNSFMDRSSDKILHTYCKPGKGKNKLKVNYGINSFTFSSISESCLFEQAQRSVMFEMFHF